MKKTLFILAIFLCLLSFCSCTDNRIYTAYNPQLYYGMPFSDAHDLLSKSHLTMAFGDEISHTVLKPQDFMQLDDGIVYVTPTVTYKFKEDKLNEISHKYEFYDSLSESEIELYNLYLSMALGVNKQELECDYREFNGTDLLYSMHTFYYTENERVLINWFNGVVLGDSITISFEAR